MKFSGFLLGSMKSRIATLCATLSVGAMMTVGTPVHAQEVYVQGGTQGGGIGAALGVMPWLGFHADIDGFNFSHSFHAGGNKFDGEAHIRHAGVYADLFPFPNSWAGGFRVTGGALFNHDRVTGSAVPENGYYSINGVKIPAAAATGQYANVEARFPTVMPYLGLGWGHKPVSKGFGFVADIGVAYGKPSVSFQASPLIVALAGSQLQAEEDSVRNSIQKVKIFPVVQIGISYRF